MNYNKFFALLCGAAFIVCGCEQGTTPKPRAEDGFTSVQQLSDYTASVPQNDVDSPYELKLSGVNLEGGLNGIFAALNGRYASLDLSGCTGIEIESTPMAEREVRQNRDRLTGLILPSSITAVGDYAFYETESLKTIGLPAGLGSIGAHAFERCTSLLELSLPDRVMSVGAHAFAACSSLVVLRLSNSLASIGDYAFAACTALTECYLPEAPPTLGQYVFSGSPNLTLFIPNNRSWGNYNGLINEGPSVIVGRWATYHHFFVLLNPEDEEDRIRLYFDYGRRRSPLDSEEPGTYASPAGRLLVLAPVRWGISENAAFEWKVNGAVQAGMNGEYFRFTPPAQGRYTVTCTAREGEIEKTAVTFVDATAPEGTYKKPVTQNSRRAAAYCFDFTPAPGGFVGSYPPIDFSDSSTEEYVRQKCQNKLDGIEYLAGEYWDGWSLAGCGGYLITGFDHSVLKRDEGKELIIESNTLNPEPGIVWVMQDSNGNSEPDDVWYELKGVLYNDKTLAPKRYAITWFDPYMKNGKSVVTWIDNQGNSGFDSNAQYPHSIKGSSITFVMSKLNTIQTTGYVDTAGGIYFSIASAVQADGTPADLAYIDFVKVQSAALDGGFGGASTEMGAPQDGSVPGIRQVIGLHLGGGIYRYTFVNESSLTVTVTLKGMGQETPANLIIAPGASQMADLPFEIRECYLSPTMQMRRSNTVANAYELYE